MSARTEGLLLIGVLILVSFVFQLQLKIFADEMAPVLARADIGLGSKVGALIRALINWRPVLIMLLALLLFVVWFLALTRLELSLALPVASIALVLNTIGSGIMLGEGLSPLRLAGVLIVAAGISLVLKS